MITHIDFNLKSVFIFLNGYLQSDENMLTYYFNIVTRHTADKPGITESFRET